MINALLRIPRMSVASIMAALPSVLNELAEQAAFRIYIAETLHAMGDNKRLTIRYIDLIRPCKQKKTDSRTANEIADDIIRKCGLIRKEVTDE